MRTFCGLSLLSTLTGCAPGVGLLVDKGLTSHTGTTPSETDADTDADSDSDTDSDTDSDSDTDTEPTGHSGTVPDEPPADHYVDCTGAGDFLTIQEAIDAAVSGQSIGVRPCEYHERIQYRGKALNVFGTQGAAATILDGDSDGTVVNVEEGESDGTRFAGFTVRNGDDNEGASGLEVLRATLDVEDVWFTDNDRSASVIQSYGGLLRLRNVVVTGNEVSGHAIESDEGGGISAKHLEVDCDGGEDALWHHNTLVLADSIVRCPGGIGVVDYHGEDRIVRSVITGDIGILAYDNENLPDLPDNPNELFLVSNSVVIGATVGVDVRYMYAELRNSLFSGGDAALAVAGMRADSTASGVGFVESGCGIRGDLPFDSDDCGFWNNTQNGCGVDVNPDEDTDPLFVAWPTDPHLQVGSPWIDRGPRDASRNDLDGTRNDLGVYGGPLAF